MAVFSLRIGIETEVLLCALDMQDQCKGSIEEFANSLVQYYNTKAGENPGQIKMRMESDVWHASDNPENLALWSVVVEASIDPDSDDWGLEFASPIIHYEPGSPWRQNLRSHFQIIESYAKIMSDVTCGTHVHVSPGDSNWTLEQVKNISRSILYFEEAFEVLLPPERRGNLECRSNRVENPRLKNLPDLDACFQKIQECTTMKDLVHLMNAKEEDLSKFCEESSGEITVTERRYGFNFENLLPGKIGTIGMHCIPGKSPTEWSLIEAEFRRPPCVTNYEDCVMWAEFGASFMQAAMQYGTSPNDFANLWVRCRWFGGICEASYHTGHE